MRISKWFAGFGSFLLLCVLITQLLNFLLIPYTAERYKIHGIETGDYDTLVVGSSHGAAGIDPDVLNTKLHANGVFNACLGGEYPIDSYYLIRDAVRNHKLARVIYELDPSYWQQPPYEGGDYLAFEQEMSWSRVKISYIRQKSMQADVRNVLFPWYNYRTRLKHAADTVKAKMSENYRNYGLATFRSDYQAITANGQIRIHGDGKPDTSLNINEFKPWKQKPEPRKYFLSLVQFCKENNIPLIVVTTPVPKQTFDTYQGSFEAASEYYADICKSLSVPYYNFNTIHMSGMNLDISRYADNEGHMLQQTAAQFTGFLADQINGAG